MKVPSITLLLQAFSNALKRFPLTVASATTAVIVVMMILEKNESDVLPKIWMMAQLGIPLFTALATFSEAHQWTWKGRGALLQIAGIALLFMYGWSLPDVGEPGFEIVHLLRYAILLLVAHLFVSYAPYMNQFSVANFWEYNKQLFANLIVGAAYAFILWAGLSLAILAVDQLFQLKVDYKIYAHLLVLLLGFFNTTFFLYHFPARFEFADQDLSYTLVFKTLSKYILIPIVTLYFLILYAYSAKILVTWSLPIGWVASLVIGFSIAGILTYLLNYMLPVYDPSPVAIQYRRWFWWGMLPMVVLLFVAISRRIMDYGFTEERFFVAHIGVWLLLTGSYFAISKTDNIKFVPISLSVFGLIAVLGPFSAFNVALRSQKGILKQLLEKNERLSNGKIMQNEHFLPEKDGKQIISSLEFLDKHNELSSLEAWLPTSIDSLNVKGSGALKQITNWMNIRWEKANDNANDYVRVNASMGTYKGKTDNFTQIFQIDLNDYSNNVTEGRTFKLNAQKNGFIYFDRIKGKENLIDTFYLGYYLKDWLRKSTYGTYTLPENKSAFDFKRKNTELRLIINQLEFAEKGQDFEINSLNGIVLIRETKTK